MLKIGLVGVGGISGAHIPAWNAMEDTTLTAICDIRPERMEPYPEPHHYTSIDEMLEKEELDILDICLPTYLHVPTAVKAMKKGIHVLSEKPISLKEEDIELAYSTAKENNVCFMSALLERCWEKQEPKDKLLEHGGRVELLYWDPAENKSFTIPANTASSCPATWDASAAILPGAGTTG